MRFWDSSALLPLCVQESATRDPAMAVWWGATVECVSAISRLRREGVLTDDQERAACHTLSQLANGWWDIQPGEAVRNLAVRLLRVHPLRAADALQLAAALVWAAEMGEAAVIVTLDHHLAAVAAREGLVVEGLRPA